MSVQLKPNPKDLTFNKADRRVLLRQLEKLYTTKLWNYNFVNRTYPSVNKTNNAKYERRFRMEIKAVELLLHSFGSDFMSNVKVINHRKTTSTNAGNNGLIESQRPFVDGHD